MVKTATATINKQLNKSSHKTMESFSVYATLKGKTYDNNSITVDPSIEELVVINTKLVVEFRPMFLILCVLLLHAISPPYKKL
jgi:hypothetical protein